MPKSLPQRFNDAEVEAVRGLWLHHHGLQSPRSIPVFKWAQGVLETCKRMDIEPWALIRRFPKQTPRIGWWGMLKWLERNPKPLEVGETGFGSWQAKIVAVRSEDRAFDADFKVVEVIAGIFIRLPKGKVPPSDAESGTFSMMF